MIGQRQAVYRSERWLRAVRSLEYCVRCGAYGVQAAHINLGKGMGKKVDDCLTAALCPQCHHEIDNGKSLSRDERRELLRQAALDTLVQLARMGLIEVRHDP